MVSVAKNRRWRGWLFLLVVNGLACTHAPWNPHRGWRAWKTANVTVYAETVFEPTVTIEDMETSYLILASTFFHGFAIPPVEVIQIPNAGYTPFLGPGGGAKMEAVFTGLHVGASRTPHSILLVSERVSRGTGAHLLAHHFIEAAAPRSPLWFHEGLGRYLSAFASYGQSGEYACFGIVRPYAVGGMLEPLPELFALSWADHNRQSAPNMNVTAWGLVDYLLHGRDGTLAPSLRSLMRALAAGANGYPALASVYPPEVVKTIDEDMPDHTRHVTKQALCPLPYRMSAPARPRTTVTVAPVPEATMKAFFEAFEALPSRTGYADHFPPQ
jgi:hypothetical protein